MRVAILLSASLGVVAAPLLAQAPERAAFITRLGRDTIAVERYTRTGNRIEGDLLNRQRGTRRIHYVLTLWDDGRLLRWEASSAPLAGGPGQPQGSVITFESDSAVVALKRGDSTTTLRPPLSRAVLPLIFLSFPLYEQGIERLVASGQDSTTIEFYSPGARGPTPTALSRRGRDSVAIDFFGSPFVARVDQAGRILGLDGRATTVKVLVERTGDADIDQLGATFAALDQAGKGIGQVSPRDTARAELAGAKVEIDYSRPRMRGRKVFGELVPWEQVWRTGADAATQLTTDNDLMIAGTRVPAGKYTLWSLPTTKGVTLIINSQTGQWGTEYDAARDFARVPLRSRRLDAPVEAFTIAFLPDAKGGTLTLSWERTRWDARVEAAR
jgi:DUF2911 family protein